MLIPLPPETTADVLPMVLQAVQQNLLVPELRKVAVALALNPTNRDRGVGKASTVVRIAGASRPAISARQPLSASSASAGVSRSHSMPPGGSLSGFNKDDLIRMIVAAATRQRTMFGSCLNVASAVREAVNSCSPTSARDLAALPPLVRVGAHWVVRAHISLFIASAVAPVLSDLVLLV